MKFWLRGSDLERVGNLVNEIRGISTEMTEVITLPAERVNVVKLNGLFRNTQQVKVLAGALEKFMLTCREV